MSTQALLTLFGAFSAACLTSGLFGWQSLISPPECVPYQRTSLN